VVEEYFARFAFWLAVLLALVLFVVIPLIFLGRFGRPLSDEVKNQGLFDGLVGSFIVALAALLLAGGYAVLQKEYGTETVCTAEPLGKILREIGVDEAKPILVHVRDGIGTAKAGHSLLTRYRQMQQEGTKWCADVKYDRRLGFQFKIFVLAREDPSETIAKFSKNSDFVPQKVHSGVQDGTCRTMRTSEEDRPVYLTMDRLPENGPWRVWILLQDYLCITEELRGLQFGKSVLNNFVQPSDWFSVDEKNRPVGNEYQLPEWIQRASW